MSIGFVKKTGVVSKAISPIQKSAFLRSGEVTRVHGQEGKLNFLTRALTGRLTYAQMREMSIRNIWVRACIDKTISRLSMIEPIVKPVLAPGVVEPNGKQRDRMMDVQLLLMNPNENRESFMNLRKKYFRDVMVYDAGALTVDFDPREYASYETREIPVALYAAPGEEVRLNVDSRGMFSDPEKAYSQIQYSREVQSWSIDELIYLISNPQSGSVYGISPLESLVQTVTAELYASAYNIDFFANNATPRIAVTFDKMGAGEAAEAKMRRFQAYWESELKGKPHKPIFVGADGQGTVKIDKMNMSNEDMQFIEYSKWLLVKIMAIYSMQPLVLGLVDVSMGKLNSAQQQQQFKEDALKPKLRLEAWHLNSELIWPSTSLGYGDVYIDYEAVDLLDLETLSRVWKSSVDGGWLTVNEVRGFLGMPPLPVDEEFEPGDKKLAKKARKAIAETAGLSPEQARMNSIRFHRKKVGLSSGLQDLENSEIAEIITQVLEKRTGNRPTLELQEIGKIIEYDEVT